MASTADLDATKLVGLNNIFEVVALARKGIPELKASISLVSLAHHVDHKAIRETATADNVRLVPLALLFIDVAEVVGEDDGVLLVISTAKVEELLCCRPEVGQVLEHP